MAYAIGVKADVVDIRRSCSLPDHLFVDTNVWSWFTYTRASQASRPPLPHQTYSYPKFLKAVLSSGGQLYHSGLQLSELMHVIEGVEREIYFLATGEDLSSKEFRHEHPTERQRVVAEVTTAWLQIEQSSAPIECTITAELTAAALARFAAEPLDGYDLYFIETLLRSGLTNRVLTDDGDFATVPDIVVYTANKTVLEQARAAGRLMVP